MNDVFLQDPRSINSMVISGDNKYSILLSLAKSPEKAKAIMELGANPLVLCKDNNNNDMQHSWINELYRLCFSDENVSDVARGLYGYGSTMNVSYDTDGLLLISPPWGLFVSNEAIINLERGPVTNELVRLFTHFACKHENHAEPIARFIEDVRYDAVPLDNCQHTVLHLSTLNRAPRMVKRLANARNINTRDCHGKTALGSAILGCYKNCFDELTAHPACDLTMVQKYHQEIVSYRGLAALLYTTRQNTNDVRILKAMANKMATLELGKDSLHEQKYCDVTITRADD